MGLCRRARSASRFLAGARRSPLSKQRSFRIISKALRMEEFACPVLLLMIYTTIVGSMVML